MTPPGPRADGWFRLDEPEPLYDRPAEHDDWPEGWIVHELRHGRAVWPHLTRRWREQHPDNAAEPGR